MTRCKHSLTLLAGLTAVGLSAPPAASAQTRTAPDIQNPGAQTGTGVNRLGIMTDSTGPRRTNVVAPGGGFFFGHSPGFFYPYRYSRRTYFYPDYFYYDDYYRYPRYLPPVVGDAGALYGPRAVQDFLGLDASNAAQASRGPLRAAAAAAPEAPPPLSNPTVRARAWRFVEYGDRQFQKGEYRQALDRYRKAQSQASEIPDVYFREGFANMAAGRYAEAVVAMREGLRLDPSWPSSGFVLEELFPTVEAKREIYRQLHTHLADRPNDADALFMLAVMQHFDGHEAAAEVRFRRVVELTGLGEHARAFLPLAPESEDAQALQPARPSP